MYFTVLPTVLPSTLQEFDAFLAALAPVLARLSYAFSSMVLVCEGSAGFQAQVGSAAAGGRSEESCRQKGPALAGVQFGPQQPNPLCCAPHTNHLSPACPLVVYAGAVRH